MMRFFGRAGAAAAEELAPEPFSFPEPLPTWPQGGGFGTGRICVGGGELELAAATAFDKICALSSSARPQQQQACGVTFYRPSAVPDGFSVLGHYCQPNKRPLHGHLLVARAADALRSPQAPLCAPQDYELVWAFHAAAVAGASSPCSGYGRSDAYFWLPVPPEGYRALGFLVTTGTVKPSLDDVRCVRADLTEDCEPHGSLLHLQLTRPSSASPGEAFAVRGLRPLHRGMWQKGIGAGTFCCAVGVGGCSSPTREQGLACLKNVDLDLSAMPTLEQVQAVIRHYGPTLFFHPKEVYLPSSVSWYFKNGARLFKKGGGAVGEEIDAEGSNLPAGGCNDGEYWMDLPVDVKRRQAVYRGDIESAELYAHVKPAMGGTCTDVAMWVFCPFNGPARLKLGMVSLPLGTTGQHVGDWEHFTFRVSNFTGELMAVYYSQHSGGRWVDASALEYAAGNKPAVYSSRNGHASYPYPGVYLQGSAAIGVGILNDAARSNLYVDSSVKYRIMAAEYLGEGVVAEPPWLQFMREWGPTVIYKSKTRMEGMNKSLPLRLSGPTGNMINKMPNELSKEEGPTGPKEKNMWEGDERW